MTIPLRSIVTEFSLNLTQRVQSEGGFRVFDDQAWQWEQYSSKQAKTMDHSEILEVRIEGLEFNYAAVDYWFQRADLL